MFLPQIVIIFLFILLLEDFGYMARAAFLMDRIMGGAGLHGRAFIPLLSSFACAIPGIMATRVIDNRRDRLTTILIAPLMTCSARIPVYTLIISAFIPDERGLGLRQSARAGDVRPLRRPASPARSGMSFADQILHAARLRAGAASCWNCRTTRLPRAQAASRSASIRRAMMFLQRAGTTIFSMMVLDLVPGLVPAAAARAPRARDRLQPRRRDRQGAASRCWRRSASTGRSRWR